MIGSAAVVGSAGAMGRMLVEGLAGSGIAVRSIDVADGTGDICAPSPELTDALRGSDLVILALPEVVALGAIGTIDEYLRKGSLLVDTLSVKSEICDRLQTLRDLESVSINPLFAPSLGMRGGTVAVIRINAGPKAARFEQLMRSWGLRQEVMSAKEHDAVAGLTQAATHAAVLAVAGVMSASGLSADQILRCAPPPHRLLLSLAARISAAAPEVYFDIQAENPMASEARSSIIDNVADLDGLADTRNLPEFTRRLESFSTWLGVHHTELAELAHRACDLAQAGDRTELSD